MQGGLGTCPDDAAFKGPAEAPTACFMILLSSISAPSPKATGPCNQELLSHLGTFIPEPLEWHRCPQAPPSTRPALAASTVCRSKMYASSTASGTLDFSTSLRSRSAGSSSAIAKARGEQGDGGPSFGLFERV